MKWRRAALWVIQNGSGIRAWTVRVATFYAGYRILHHEVYETDTSEPLLIFLGLWLCGVAPATFFDSLRKVGMQIHSEVERATSTEGVPEGPSPKATDKPELESGDVA